MPDVSLEQIKEDIRFRTDIVDLVSQYVPLKRAGTTYKGLCPFHNEKTPSFTVNQQRQRYHCFGCDADGDVFSFVMQHQRLDFMEALKLLGRQVGVDVEAAISRNPKQNDERKRLFDIHQKLITFYNQALLNTEKDAEVIDYCRDRKLGKKIVDAFGLGYAAPNGASLLDWAKAEGISLQELIHAGIIKEPETARDREQPYNRFLNRLMFPLFDEQGRCVGFSGRVLPSNESPAKYVNSPETPIFRKSKIIYGLHLARKDIAEKRQALFCEGQMDVIRCHQAGFTHAIAALGTAITTDHARMLARYADEVVLLLDSDAAGEKAALRSIPIFLQAGLSIQVATFPSGEDPDSILLKLGKEAFEQRLTEATPCIEFQINTLKKAEGSESEASFLRIAKAVTQTIAAAASPLQREQLSNQAACILGCSVDALHQEMKQQKKPTPVATPASAEAPPVDTRLQAEELSVLELLFHNAETRALANEFLEIEHFSNEAARELFKHFQEQAAAETLSLPPPDPNTEKLIQKLQDSNRHTHKEEDSPLAAMQSSILVLRGKYLERQRAALLNQLDQEQNASQREIKEQESIQLTLVITKLREARLKNQWNAVSELLEVY